MKQGQEEAQAIALVWQAALINLTPVRWIFLQSRVTTGGEADHHLELPWEVSSSVGPGFSSLIQAEQHLFLLGGLHSMMVQASG